MIATQTSVLDFIGGILGIALIATVFYDLYQARKERKQKEEDDDQSRTTSI